MSEEQALNECGRGFAWRRVHPEQPLEDDSTWEAIIPSTPADPPCKGEPNKLEVEHFKQLADREGLTDNQLLSWVMQGFPGVGLEKYAVLVPPHVGALKEAETYNACVQRDVEWGFVTEPSAFPEQWPCVLDPCNIVVQNGKPRLTIDKTMWISGRAEMPPANLLINLIAEAATAGRLKLVTVGQVARAAAILKVALKVYAHLSSPGRSVQLLMKKHDLKAFFRFHAKQRAHVREQGKVVKGGYSVDKRVNFGERNAPDHTCRESDALTFFSRRELARLDAEYPTRAPELLAWLEHRRHLRAEAGADADEFGWDVLFWICYYVDDGGLLCFDDLLFDKAGRPVTLNETSASGVISSKQQCRIDMYGEACIQIAIYIGHQCPEDKRDEGIDLIYLGITLALESERRILPRVKALSYKLIVEQCIVGRRVMPNGLVINEYSNSTPSCTVCCTPPRSSRWGSSIYLLHAQSVEGGARSHGGQKKDDAFGDGHEGGAEGAQVVGSPAGERRLFGASAVASCYSFPGVSSANTLIRYSDASRELDKPANDSGGGAWVVIGDTFYYIQIVWERIEIEKNSINVLEAHMRDMGGKVFLDLASELGLTITHTTAYVDNTAAECIAENGRASTDMMHELNRLRLLDLQARGVYETNERIASEDNDVADLISRGALDSALFYPRDCGLKCVECAAKPSYRELPVVA